jgi:Spy/CpxP family protein refolding chaperone
MRIIATLILCFLPTYFMYGQPQKELDEHLNTYVKVLGLTGEQKNQFQILFQEQATADRRIQERNHNNPQKLMLEMQNGIEAFEQKIKAILTEKQWDKYRQMNDKWPIDRRFQELKNELDLDDKQIELLKPVLDKTRDIIFSLGQKGLSHQDYLKAVKVIMDRQARKIEDILTPEQQKKFADMRKSDQRRLPPPLKQR